MLAPGEDSIFDFFPILPDSRDSIRLKICVFFNELRYKAVEQTEHIVHNKNLTIAVWPTADTDGWNSKYTGDLLRKRCRYCFKDNREGPGALKKFSILHQPLRRLFRSALDFMAAHAEDCLGHQPYMRHNRDFRLC